MYNGHKITDWDKVVQECEEEQEKKLKVMKIQSKAEVNLDLEEVNWLRSHPQFNFSNFCVQNLKNHIRKGKKNGSA